MDNERNKTLGSNDTSSSSGSERVITGLNGETFKLRGTSNTQDTGIDEITGDSRISEEDRGAPQFTRPNTLEMFGWDDEKQKEKPGTKRGPSGKNVVSPKTTPGLNAKTCGNIAAGIVDAISFLLTRTPVLGLSEEEEKDIGESLYETVSNFPATSATVKFLNFVAPWAGLMHTSSKIVMKRLAFIEKHKVRPQPKQAPLFPENTSGIIFAPDPSRAN